MSEVYNLVTSRELVVPEQLGIMTEYAAADLLHQSQSLITHIDAGEGTREISFRQDPDVEASPYFVAQKHKSGLWFVGAYLPMNGVNETVTMNFGAFSLPEDTIAGSQLAVLRRDTFKLAVGNAVVPPQPQLRVDKNRDNAALQSVVVGLARGIGSLARSFDAGRGTWTVK